jgi:hypothetical protein
MKLLWDFNNQKREVFIYTVAYAFDDSWFLLFQDLHLLISVMNIPHSFLMKFLFDIRCLFLLIVKRCFDIFLMAKNDVIFCLFNNFVSCIYILLQFHKVWVHFLKLCLELGENVYQRFCFICCKSFRVSSIDSAFGII